MLLCCFVYFGLLLVLSRSYKENVEMNDKESATNNQSSHSDTTSSIASIKDVQVAPTKTQFETFARNETNETRDKNEE